MYPKIVSLFDDGQAVSLEKGQVLFRNEEPVKFMFLVEEGCLELVRHTRSGTRLSLSRVRHGSVLAEASAYADTYHCDGVSLVRSRVKRVPNTEFLQKLTSDPSLQYGWAKTLARELQAARMNAEVRTLRTVAEKVDVWLESNKVLPPKGELLILARVLGVSREALYRELAKRKS
jgi:CRP-like cAMP-binding protein